MQQACRQVASEACRAPGQAPRSVPGPCVATAPPSTHGVPFLPGCTPHGTLSRHRATPPTPLCAPHLSQQVHCASEQARRVTIVQAAVAHEVIPGAARGPRLHQARQPQVHRDRRAHGVPDLLCRRGGSRGRRGRAAMGSRARRVGCVRQQGSSVTACTCAGCPPPARHQPRSAATPSTHPPAERPGACAALRAPAQPP